MRSLGDLPRPVLVLEGIGMLLLILAYLCIHGHVQLPGMFGSQMAAVGMIFLGVALMVPAAAFLVWRVVQGFSPLMRGDLPPDSEQHGGEKQDRDPRR